MKKNILPTICVRLMLLLSSLITIVACGEDDPALLPESVSLDRTAITLAIGERTQLTAVVLPAISSDKSLLWQSSNTAIATVDGNGNVTAHQAGQSTILVSTHQGGQRASCAVTVSPDPIAVSSVSLNLADAEMAVGDRLTLIATITPAQATNKSLSWNSSDPTIAAIDDAGAIIAISPGQTIITVVTQEGLKTANCVVTVRIASLVPIPAGLFTMGSPASEFGRELEEIERQVQISAFRMSQKEITNAQYCAFLNAKNIGSDGKWNGASFDPAKVFVFDSAKGGRRNWGVNYDSTSSKWKPALGKENFPVVYVTWFGALEFARWSGGTLPTEAQWEYACRGKNSALPFGLNSGKRLTGVMANIAGKEIYDLDLGGTQADALGAQLDMPTPAGAYTANVFGLYDMHGNISEWCLDLYASYSTTQPSYKDPQGPTTSATNQRVIRGGSYSDKALFCRAAYRRGNLPETELESIGFRIVLPVL